MADHSCLKSFAFFVVLQVGQDPSGGSQYSNEHSGQHKGLLLCEQEIEQHLSFTKVITPQYFNILIVG